jgi:hypothetical protein
MARFEVTVTPREDAWPDGRRVAAVQRVPAITGARRRATASAVALQCYQEGPPASASRSRQPR